MNWLTPEQVAQDPRLPIGNADWVRKQLNAGRLEGSKVGGRWLVREDAIDTMLNGASNVARRRKKRAA